MYDIIRKSGHSMRRLKSYPTKAEAESAAVQLKKEHPRCTYTVEKKAPPDKEHEDLDVHGVVKDTLKKSRSHAEKSKNIPETIPESMKTGGMVQATKPHLLHKGEMVVPKTVVKHLEKLLKKK